MISPKQKKKTEERMPTAANVDNVCVIILALFDKTLNFMEF